MRKNYGGVELKSLRLPRRDGERGSQMASKTINHLPVIAHQAHWLTVLNGLWKCGCLHKPQMIAPISVAVMICRAHGGADVPPSKSLLQAERENAAAGWLVGGGIQLCNSKCQPAGFTSSYAELGCIRSWKKCASALLGSRPCTWTAPSQNVYHLEAVACAQPSRSWDAPGYARVCRSEMESAWWFLKELYHMLFPVLSSPINGVGGGESSSHMAEREKKSTEG